jgi:conjugal transfer pilus assembly protein TraW
MLFSSSLSKTITWALLLTTLFSAVGANAVDLGTIGPTYVITEPDFVDEMTEIARKKVVSGEWKRVEENVKRGAMQFFENVPALAAIATADNARVFYFDPAVRLKEPISDHLGNMIYAAGTVVNPLDVLPLSEPFLFIDGRDTRQLTYAKQQYERLQGRLKLILTAGPFLAISKDWPVAVYYDQQGLMTARLGIDRVPALVSQEDRRLRIEVQKP